ncbi:ATPase H transporting lysosomal accessory [Echinococcus multilocularis]|uniref:ATPase H transporting lysosomal accessory n=1 Tax=Echinococcus multilocularis TaxID=6211 RepID=A0A068Y055_ECHMU|nr:ATPase H transporting lysosomal accessory [Echinococcus multilocularis]
MSGVCLALLVFLLVSLCQFMDSLAQPVPSPDNFIYLNFTCLAFYARKIHLFINEDTPKNYTMQPKNPVAFCGDNKTASLSFIADAGSPTVSSLNISFGFLSDGYRYWSLNTSTVQFNNKIYSLSMKWLDSPISMGFKCSDMGRVAAVNSTPSVEFSFLGLQVQPFGITNGVFTEANDCVGFFTTEIFSNLFVIFLLLGIFTYGLVMIMGIQTNDSFDDPKHKMIQIGGTSD